MEIDVHMCRLYVDEAKFAGTCSTYTRWVSSDKFRISAFRLRVASRGHGEDGGNGFTRRNGETEGERRRERIRRGRPATQAVATGRSTTSARTAPETLTVRALVLDRRAPPLRGAASNAQLRCTRRSDE